MGIAERGRGALWGKVDYHIMKDQKLAAKSCTWFDSLFKWIGIAVVAVGTIYLAYRIFIKPHYVLLHIPLARQLGI